MLIVDVIMCMDFQYLGTILLLSRKFLLSIRKKYFHSSKLSFYLILEVKRDLLIFTSGNLLIMFFSAQSIFRTLEISCCRDRQPAWASLCPSPCSLAGLVISTLSCCFLLLTYWVIPAAGFLLIMPFWFSLYNVSLSPYTNIFHTCTHLSVPI